MNVKKVTTRRFDDISTCYDTKDTILYALGVGFGAEPLDPRHLRFLYEDGLLASPTFANVLGHPGFWVREEEYGVDWKRLLHAEQRLTMRTTVPAAGKVLCKSDIMGIRDKGAEKGALMFQRKEVSDAATGTPIALVVTTLMLRGDGGCGDYGEAPPELERLPDGPPDALSEVQTELVTPLIYRLSGDLNPLHIDPAVAAQAGFPRPILHGLATKGFAGYAILKTFCDLDPSRLKSMALRFSRPVMPGDRIRFEYWRPEPGLIRFRALVPARDEIVLDRGTAEISA